MYCTKCGMSLPDDVRYCTSCGNDMKPENVQERMVSWSQEDLEWERLKKFDAPWFDDYYKEEFERICTSKGKYKGKFNWRLVFMGRWNQWTYISKCWLSELVVVVAAAFASVLMEMENTELSSIGSSLAFSLVIYEIIHRAWRGNYVLYCSCIKRKQQIF